MVFNHEDTKKVTKTQRTSLLVNGKRHHVVGDTKVLHVNVVLMN